MPFPSSLQIRGGSTKDVKNLFLEHAGGSWEFVYVSRNHCIFTIHVRSPIVSKAQAPSTEPTRLDSFLGTRLAHVVVVFAAFGVMRFRPQTAEDVEAEICANVFGLHGPRLSQQEELLEDCVNSAVVAMNHCAGMSVPVRIAVSAVQEHVVVICSSHCHSQRNDFPCQNNSIPTVPT